MPKIGYIDKQFADTSLAVIAQANRIIAAYQAQGYTLTLRQLYYQFVARDLLANTERNYKRLGKIISEGRLAGLIDWEALEDRGRFLRTTPTWSCPAAIIRGAADQYKIDLWERQPCYAEVWIEKDALVGVIEGVCKRLRVPYFACRGYNSQSEQWRAGRRLGAAQDEGKDVVILHLGDHDPSGIDMTRDNNDRLDMFAEGDVEVRRLALNYDQVEQYNPPPNPTKLSDSRATGYIDRFGYECWELDALDPPVIERLIADALEEYIDPTLWDEDLEREAEERARLSGIADTLDDEED